MQDRDTLAYLEFQHEKWKFSPPPYYDDYDEEEEIDEELEQNEMENESEKKSETFYHAKMYCS